MISHEYEKTCTVGHSWGFISIHQCLGCRSSTSKPVIFQLEVPAFERIINRENLSNMFYLIKNYLSVGGVMNTCKRGNTGKLFLKYLQISLFTTVELEYSI